MHCVTVIVPVLNAERSLSIAVRSAVHIVDVGEVIIVDDASNDASLSIARGLADEFDKVRVITAGGGMTRGPGWARNLAIREAGCNVVAFLDADDAYLPLRFKEHVSLLRSRDDIDGVYGNVRACFEDGAAKKKWFSRYSTQRYGVRAPVRPDALFETLLNGCSGHFHTNAITVRKSLLDKVGGFDEDLWLGQDSAMWLRMALMGRVIGPVPDYEIALWRIHRGNRSFQSIEEKRQRVQSCLLSVLAWGEQTDVDQEALSKLRQRISKVA